MFKVVCMPKAGEKKRKSLIVPVALLEALQAGSEG